MNLKNSNGCSFNHTYTADAKNLDIPAPAFITQEQDLLDPQITDACCRLEPYGATGVVLGIASAIVGIAAFPEMALGLALLSAGYGIYGVGVASGWFCGGGGGGDLLQ